MIHSFFIIKDGIPLISQVCSPKAPQFAIDDTRLTGLLAAMNTFCAELGGVGEMRTLQTTNNLQFSFTRATRGKEEILLVACHDADLPADAAQRTLSRVGAQFMTKFQTLPNYACKSGVFADFARDLPDYLRDAPSRATPLPPTPPNALPALPPLPAIPTIPSAFTKFLLK